MAQTSKVVKEPVAIVFKAEHLLAIKAKDNNYNETYDSMIMKENHPAFTAILDGHVIGCCGIIIQWDGVGSAWSVFTAELMTNYPLWLTRFVRRTIADVIRIFDLHRVELVAYEHVDKNLRWAEFLGFSREERGVARAYTVDKQNMVRFELINWKAGNGNV